MRCKNQLTSPLGKRRLVVTLILAITTSMPIILAGGCISSTPQQPPTTSYMRSAVGTPNELSPQAPGEAKNIRKVGNQWVCEVHGKTMVYNDARSCWEPQQK